VLELVKTKLKREMASSKYRPPEVPIGDGKPKSFPKDAKCKFCHKPYSIAANKSRGITYAYCRTKKPKPCPNSGILRDITKFGVTWDKNEVE
jgi:hypothetical protein